MCKACGRFVREKFADEPKFFGDQIEDVIEVLKSGMTPDGDYVGQGMSEVVDGTSQLTDADRRAIAVYVKSLPPMDATPK